MRTFAIHLTLLLATLPIVACQRTVDPRDILKQETRGKPINQLVQPGYADMPQDPALLLPIVYATINDEVDCRLIVDSGAGDALMLNELIFETAELKSIAPMGVAGIGGETAGSLSLVDELTIGTIKVERVMAFTLGERVPMAMFADGVIGTGVFAEGRVTFDFEHAQFVVAPSSDEPAAGSEFAVRVADRKHIFTSLQVQDQPAVAILDSGATFSIFSARWMAANYPDYPRMDLNLPIPTVVGGTDAVEPDAKTSVRLELAGRNMAEVPGIVMRHIDSLPVALFGEQPDIFIGMTMLRELRSWTIDYPRQCSWMDWLYEEPEAAAQPIP